MALAQVSVVVTTVVAIAVDAAPASVAEIPLRLPAQLLLPLLLLQVAAPVSVAAIMAEIAVDAAPVSIPALAPLLPQLRLLAQAMVPVVLEMALDGAAAMVPVVLEMAPAVLEMVPVGILAHALHTTQAQSILVLVLRTTQARSILAHVLHITQARSILARVLHTTQARSILAHVLRTTQVRSILDHVLRTTQVVLTHVLRTAQEILAGDTQEILDGDTVLRSSARRTVRAGDLRTTYQLLLLLASTTSVRAISRECSDLTVMHGSLSALTALAL